MSSLRNWPSAAASRLLGAVKGKLRFDLRSGKRTEHWRVAVNKGAVAVSQG